MRYVLDDNISKESLIYLPPTLGERVETVKNKALIYILKQQVTSLYEPDNEHKLDEYIIEVIRSIDHLFSPHVEQAITQKIKEELKS